MSDSVPTVLLLFPPSPSHTYVVRFAKDDAQLASRVTSECEVISTAREVEAQGGDLSDATADGVAADNATVTETGGLFGMFGNADEQLDWPSVEAKVRDVCAGDARRGQRIMDVGPVENYHAESDDDGLQTYQIPNGFHRVTDDAGHTVGIDADVRTA